MVSFHDALAKGGHEGGVKREEVKHMSPPFYTKKKHRRSRCNEKYPTYTKIIRKMGKTKNPRNLSLIRT